MKGTTNTSAEQGCTSHSTVRASLSTQLTRTQTIPLEETVFYGRVAAPVAQNRESPQDASTPAERQAQHPVIDGKAVARRLFGTPCGPAKHSDKNCTQNASQILSSPVARLSSTELRAHTNWTPSKSSAAKPPSSKPTVQRSNSYCRDSAVASAAEAYSEQPRAQSRNSRLQGSAVTPAKQVPTGLNDYAAPCESQAQPSIPIAASSACLSVAPSEPVDSGPMSSGYPHIPSHKIKALLASPKKRPAPMATCHPANPALLVLGHSQPPGPCKRTKLNELLGMKRNSDSLNLQQQRKRLLDASRMWRRYGTPGKAKGSPLKAMRPAACTTKSKPGSRMAAMARLNSQLHKCAGAAGLQLDDDVKAASTDAVFRSRGQCRLDSTGSLALLSSCSPVMQPAPATAVEVTTSAAPPTTQAHQPSLARRESDVPTADKPTMRFSLLGSFYGCSSGFLS